MKQLFYSIILLMLTTGCNTIYSSFNYTEGTECLNKGDYNGAVLKLEKAVELDPSFARNHTNLATAYVKLGNYDQAWLQYRQALTCKYQDGCTVKNFREFYKFYVTQQGLDNLNTSKEEIESKLGTPDMLLNRGNQYVYGICVMTFKDGRLQRVGFLD